MSAKVRWSGAEDPAPDSFNVYRAITGVTISFPNAIADGDIFLFQATSRDVQKITVGSAVTIDDIRDLINDNAHGLKATKAINGTDLFIRCTARENPLLKILPCTFQQNAGLASGLYTAAQTFELIINVASVPDTIYYEYNDLDGDALDWYRITDMIGADESQPSSDGMPLNDGDELCVVQGTVVDLQNNPIAGARVSAALEIPVGVLSNLGITTPHASTITDEYGRWSLPLIREQLVLFQIEAIGYNEIVIMPDAAFVLFKDLKPVDDHLFAPGGDPIA